MSLAAELAIELVCFCSLSENSTLTLWSSELTSSEFDPVSTWLRLDVREQLESLLRVWQRNRECRVADLIGFEINLTFGCFLFTKLADVCFRGARRIKGLPYVFDCFSWTFISVE